MHLQNILPALFTIILVCTPLLPVTPSEVDARMALASGNMCRNEYPNSTIMCVDGHSYNNQISPNRQHRTRKKRASLKKKGTSFLKSQLGLGKKGDKKATTAPTISTSGINKKIMQELAAMEDRLPIVGDYLATHKYFDIDWRYEGTDDGMGGIRHFNPEYMRKFPVPRLRKLHRRLKTACEAGIFECVDEIFEVAIQTPGFRAARKNKRLLSESPPEYKHLPFSSMKKQFKFRTTASYYMCWYTMLGDKWLERFGRKCLNFHNQYEAVKKLWPKDYRAEDSIDYACALLSFCPDPCCGKLERKASVENEKHCRTSVLNPCFAKTKGSCSIVRDENVNFDDLIRNRINISCDCHVVRNGHRWNTRWAMCVDKDECYEDDYKCGSNEVCHNTVGAYECRCRRGYRRNETTQECKRHLVIDELPPMASEEPREKTKNKAAVVFLKTMNYVSLPSALSASTRVHVEQCAWFLWLVMLLFSVSGPRWYNERRMGN